MSESHGKPTDILTGKEAAAYMKLSRRTLYVLAREGKIPATRIGGEWRFSRTALENCVRGQVSPSKTQS